jgi:branched-chain amino acid transport system permease protein
MAAAIGLFLGWPTIRTRGDYLALVTLGFGEMIRLLMRNWVDVTNGPQGLMNVPPPSVAGLVVSSPVAYYYLGLLFCTFTLTLFARVKRSSVGLQLTAIRDDEGAAAAVGVDPVRWKLYAFALGALVAGVAGAFFASWQRFVSPESFTLNESILVLCIVVLGGMGKLWPTVGAAFLLVLLPEALRGLESYRALVLGFSLVILVLAQERLRQGRHAVMAASVVRDSASDVPPSASKTPYRSELLLKASGLAKSFGGIRALGDVSFDLYQGEILGVVGANGAGKTTLFGCISGTLPLDAGEIVLVNGDKLEQVQRLAPFRRARLGVARTFQQPRLFSSLTALENVELGSRCRSVPALWEPLLPPRGGEKARVAESRRLLAAAGAPTGPTPVESMSFVDQKLTELARALATRPKLLLADEPAAGMEPAARQRLAKLLRWVNRELEVTVVVVEHDVQFLNSICSRILVMAGGEIRADGAPGSEAVRKAVQATYQAQGGWNPHVGPQG